MSFFDQFAFDGKVVDGSEKNANVQANEIIPGGTMAVAMIESFKWDEYQGAEKIKVQWKLANGDFTGRVIFQTIDIFSSDQKKAFRAANVLKMLFLLTGTPTPDAKPTDADFAQMVGQMAGITLDVWSMDGKEGNWVAAIAPAKGFEPKTGTRMPKPSTAPAAGAAKAYNADEPLW